MRKKSKIIFLLITMISTLVVYVILDNFDDIKAAVSDLIIRYDTTKSDEGQLVDSTTLPVPLTKVPLRVKNEGWVPEGADKDLVIKGEYAFVPKWRVGKTVCEIVINGVVVPEGDARRSGGVIQIFSDEVGDGKETYIRFTNMGIYNGKPVTVTMRPTNIPKTTTGEETSVTIGITGERADSVATDVNYKAAMSVSYTGEEGIEGASYVDIDFEFTDATSATDDPVAVRGFFTYVDFDHEESFAIKLGDGDGGANLQRIYALASDSGDEGYVAPKLPSDPDYKDWLAYRYMPDNASYYDYEPKFCQLLYKDNTDIDGYLYINRGWRSNTTASVKANWFSYIYGPTSKFSAKFNGSYLDDQDYLTPGEDNQFLEKTVADKYGEDPFYYGASNWQGSTLGYHYNTLVPIEYPDPIKTSDSDTSDEIITWEIRQDVPSRFIENSEPLFEISDVFPSELKLPSVNEIKIVDMFDEDVTNKRVGPNKDQPMWEITIDSSTNSVTVKATEAALLNDSGKNYLTDFYINSYTVIVPTTLDKTQDYSSYYDKDTEQLVFENQATTHLKNIDMSERYITSRPKLDWAEPENKKTEGRIDTLGQIEITKEGESTSATNPKLAGAEFEIINSSGTLVDTITTDDSGKATTKKIPVFKDKGVKETYTLKEVTAPSGYDKAEDTEVTISEINETEEVTIIDPKIRAAGEFSILKEVLNDLGQDIDNEMVKINQVLTYRITVSNKNTDPSSLIRDIIVEDELPAQLSYIENSIKVGKNKNSLTLVGSDVDWEENKLSKSIGDLYGYDPDDEDKNTYVIEFEVTVNPTASGTIENQANVSGQVRDTVATLKKITDVSNKVTNSLSVTLYIRQMIQNKNSQLVVPEGDASGYVMLKNIKNSESTDVAKILNKIIQSGEDFDTLSYTQVKLMPLSGYDSYVIEPIIPEMYSYTGYIVSTTSSQSLINMDTSGSYAKVDYDKEDTYYVTLFLEPKTSSIPFYNWDYRLNQFGGITL